jgi:glycerophosphoryl diester phosphodiesterase
MTSDGDAVVCHEPKYEGLVVERTTREALVGRWQSERGLACLDEVLEKFAKTAFLNIELKVDGIEDLTLALLEKFPTEKGCVVSSFKPSVIMELSRGGAKVPLGLICDAPKQLERWKELPVHALMLERRLANIAFIKEIHNAGKQVFVWTVNSAGEMKGYADAGVDGIISDDSRLLGKVLGDVSGE